MIGSCKTPLAGPAAVLDYLSRYTHRTAIGNERLAGVKRIRHYGLLSPATKTRRLALARNALASTPKLAAEAPP